MLDMMGSVIPTYLRDAGVRGARHESTADPVAVWLVSTVSDAACVRVNDYMIEAVHHDGSVESVYTPHTIAQFCSEFDNGYHPELDSNPPPRHRIALRHNGGGLGTGKPSAYFVDCACDWDGVDVVTSNPAVAQHYADEHLKDVA